LQAYAFDLSFAFNVIDGIDRLCMFDAYVILQPLAAASIHERRSALF